MDMVGRISFFSESSCAIDRKRTSSCADGLNPEPKGSLWVGISVFPFAYRLSRGEKVDPCEGAGYIRSGR
jgi:hypothetical protein